MVMSLHNKKLFIGAFILLAYISMGVFGLLQFGHVSEMPMEDCPYTQNTSAICGNSIDHINNWHQFSNVILSSVFVSFLLIFGMVLYFFDKQHFLSQQPRLFYKWKHYWDVQKFYSHFNQLNKWLSLFENSPSLSCVRHN